MPIERKLAAIMFTDIAGYTALSAKDETTCESTGGDWVGAECIELIFTK